MRRLEIGSLPLPEIYVCGKSEAKTARKMGVPYIVWEEDHELLVKLIMLPMLRKLFPHIRWVDELGLTQSSMSKLSKLVKVKVPVFHDDYDEHVAEVPALDVDSMMSGIDGREWDDDMASMDGGDASQTTEGYRYSKTGHGDRWVFESSTLEDAIGDLSDHVVIDEIQDMGLLPKWIGEIADVVRQNLEDYLWREAYDKKTGFNIGRYDTSTNAPNLIIIDVSGSIPKGIAATMLSLIATMREQAQADVIITGATSGWYPYGSDIPDASTLRRRHGRNNETDMFMGILREHVLGREWANVVSFGDNDCPWHPHWSLDDYDKEKQPYLIMMQGNNVVDHMMAKKAGAMMPYTKVHDLWSYHTIGNIYGMNIPITGYARWVTSVCPGVNVHHNTEWVRSLDE